MVCAPRQVDRDFGVVSAVSYAHWMVLISTATLVQFALAAVPQTADADTATGDHKDGAAAVDPRTQGVCLQLIEAGRYDEARGITQRLIDKQPKSSMAFLLHGLTYHKQRRYEEAEPLFAKALELDPKNYRARLFYGWCLYNLGKPSAAREQFEAFLAVDADYPDAHFALGLLAIERDDLDVAEQRFKQTIASAKERGAAGDEAKARARLADVFVRRNRLEDAKRELQRSVELNADLYAAYFKLSRVLQRLGDKEGAARARRMHDEVRKRVHPTEGHAE